LAATPDPTHAKHYARRAEAWLGRVRVNSAADLLVTSIAGAPVLTADAAATLIGRSYPQANAALLPAVGGFQGRAGSLRLREAAAGPGDDRPGDHRRGAIRVFHLP